MYLHPTWRSLVPATVLAITLAWPHGTMPLRAAANARVSAPAPVTAIALDVPDGPMRTTALAAAEQMIGRIGAQGDRIAVIHISDDDGLAVAADFTDRVGARTGLQRLRQQSTWTYRHLSTGPAGLPPTPHAAAALRSLIVDLAKVGAPARLVVLTELVPIDRRRRALEDTLATARALGVRVHVAGYLQAQENAEASLLGSTVTSTAHAMKDCDPRRVACGLAEQVGQEAGQERAGAVASAERAWASLAAGTGGMFARTPKEFEVLLQRLSSPEAGRPAGSERVSVGTPTWRERDAGAAAVLDRSGAEDASRSGGLAVLRVPSAGGVRLVLALDPATLRNGTSSGPWYAFLRVRNEQGDDLALFSESGSDPGAIVLRETGSDTRPRMVESVLQDSGAGTTRIGRHLVIGEEPGGDVAGDLFLVRAIEAATGAQAAHPLAAAGRVHLPLIPRLVDRTASSVLSAVIPVRAEAANSSLIVELLSDGQRRRTTLQMTAAGAETHFQVITLPMASLAAGVHELRVSGEHQGRPWTRSCQFEVTP